MDFLWLNISLVVFFILLGGVFAAAELALVSLRESQLHALEKRGQRGQQVARLARDPNTFLAAVQIGVTVSGFFSAAFGATALAPILADPLRDLGVDPSVAAVVAVVSMTLVVAYLSLVLGELAPKRLALQRAEGFAMVVAPAIATIAVVLKPVIWLVARSSDFVVRLLGGNPSQRSEMLSDEELVSIVESHESLGVEQREILCEVIDASNQSLGHVMRPRGDVEVLFSTATVKEARKLVQNRAFSRYPVVTKSLDDCVSFVHVRDLMWAKDTTLIGELGREIPQLPSSMRIFPAISELRSEGKHIALVVDEYGGTDGLVTLEDLIEELIGEVYDEHDPADVQLTEERLGSKGHYPGTISLRRFEDATGLALPSGPYSTLAGFLLSALGRIPEEGDVVSFGRARLVIHEMTNRKIALVSVLFDEGPGTEG